MADSMPNPNPPPELELPPAEYKYQAPAIVEKRRRRCTLAKCILSISIMEMIFYLGVLSLFTVGMLMFNENNPKMSTPPEVAFWLRSVIMGFAASYVILAIILMIGVALKKRRLLVFWIYGVLIVMMLEWISAIVAVALVLNGALFFISGSYGPVRLCFICLTGMYAQRLKFGRQGTAILPVVEPLTDGDGYRMSSKSAIFVQPSGSQDSETIRLNFQLTSSSSQSII